MNRVSIGQMLIFLHKRYRKFKAEVKVVDDAGAIRLPVTATNNADVLLFDTTGDPTYYNNFGIQRAFANLLNGQGWQVAAIVNGWIILNSK